MSYREDMRRCREYIDAHREEELSAQVLAERFGYSFWHFCHIFRSVNGLSVGVYLRDKRLARAAAELISGASVTEAAGLAGFDTPSGFTRAFCRRFGVSPSAYKKQKGGFFKMKELKMTIKDIPAFCAAGYRLFPEEAVDTREMGAFWLGKDFSVVSSEDYAKLTYPGYAEIGLWLHSENAADGLYYFLGPTIKPETAVPDNMQKYSFAPARCAVFTVPRADDMPGLQQNIRRAWHYIFNDWFEQNPYKLNQTAPYFECYHGEDTYICLPISDK